MQLVNRYRCNDPAKYLIYQEQILNVIQNTITKLKKTNIIKSFYFFPYHMGEAKIKKLSFIDGITCYRNIHQKQYDNYAKENNLKIIAMRIFGGDKKIIKKNNLKKLIFFNLRNKLVKKIIVGINSKNQLDQLIKIS